MAIGLPKKPPIDQCVYHAKPRPAPQNIIGEKHKSGRPDLLLHVIQRTLIITFITDPS